MVKNDSTIRVRVNTTIDGEVAQILLELKERGIVTSNTDAVIQGLFALYDKVVERDLALTRLKAIRESKAV